MIGLVTASKQRTKKEAFMGADLGQISFYFYLSKFIFLFFSFYLFIIFIFYYRYHYLSDAVRAVEACRLLLRAFGFLKGDLGEKLVE